MLTLFKMPKNMITVLLLISTIIKNTNQKAFDAGDIDKVNSLLDAANSDFLNLVMVTGGDVENDVYSFEVSDGNETCNLNSNELESAISACITALEAWAVGDSSDSYKDDDVSRGYVNNIIGGLADGKEVSDSKKTGYSNSSSNGSAEKTLYEFTLSSNDKSCLFSYFDNNFDSIFTHQVIDCQMKLNSLVIV